MAANAVSLVSTAITDRTYWETWGSAAAVAVAIGVAMESVTEFAWLAKVTGLWSRRKLRRQVAKLGLALLIVALIAEVVISRQIKTATDIIETNLGSGLNAAILANAGLDSSIQRERADIGKVADKVKALTSQGALLAVGIQSNSADLKKEAELRAPRALTKRQYDVLQTLRGKISVVNLGATREAEPQMFEAQILGALKAAGVRVIQYEGSLPIGAAGVNIYEKVNPNFSSPLVSVFNRAKLLGGTGGWQYLSGFRPPNDYPIIWITGRQLNFAKPPYSGPAASK